MSPKLEKQLIKKYPSLFTNIYNKHSCMAFGVEVNDGWFFLLDKLCAYIQNIENHHRKEIEYYKSKNITLPADLNEKQIGFKFEQIKEKFSKLRIYHNNPSNDISSIVNFVEFLSGYYCEDCGTSQNIGTTTDGWLTTLCQNCAVKGKRKFKLNE